MYKGNTCIVIYTIQYTDLLVLQSFYGIKVKGILEPIWFRAILDHITQNS